MAKSTRYTVSLFSAEQKSYVSACFEKCCLSALGSKENKMDVGFELSDSELKLYPSEHGQKLEHPSNCPCRFLTECDISNINKHSRKFGVQVGVSFVIQSADGHVLLTRRPKTMRSFPNIWVTPGGHLEPGETLTLAGIREVLEETGILISESSITSLGLWESVFPPLLGMGLPTAHHIVVYMLAQLSDNYKNVRLQLQESEVSAAAWLDEYTVSEITKSDDYGKSRNVTRRYFKAKVVEDGQQIDKNLPLSIMMTCLPQPEDWNGERLSSGSKFALRQWQKYKYTAATKGKLNSHTESSGF